MKNMLKALFAVTLLLYNTAYAVEPNKGVTKIEIDSRDSVKIRPFCQFGFMFLVVIKDNSYSHNSSSGVSVIQVLDKAGKPMGCVYK